MGSMKKDYLALAKNGDMKNGQDIGDKCNGHEDAKEEGMKLKAEMTLLNGCGVIIGCIIGSGIFVSPTGVLASTGSVNMSLVIWAICGIFTMIGAYCYAELGCMITKSGADYAYIHVTFGPFLAFVRIWIECMIVRPCTLAIQSLTFSLYIIKPLFPECDPPDESTRLLAAACLCLVGSISHFLSLHHQASLPRV